MKARLRGNGRGGRAKMQRRSVGSPSQLLSRGSLSPAPDGGPEPAPDGGPEPAPPASPSFLDVLYRSAIARDCEAIALRLQAAPGDSRKPPLPPRLRCASTIEAETLPPLGTSWSFLSEAFRAPEEEEEEGRGGAEQAPPGPLPAAPPPSRGGSRPDRTHNRTYEYDDGGGASDVSSRAASWADSRATYLCDEGPRLSAAGAGSLSEGDDEGSPFRRRTFEWELPAASGDVDRAPLVASTPVRAAEGAAKTGGERLPDPAHGSTGSGGRKRRGSAQGTPALRRTLAAPARSSALPKKGLPARKKSLGPESVPAKRVLRGPVAAPSIAGRGAKGKTLQGAGAGTPNARLLSSAVPGASSSWGRAGQSRTLAEKQVADEMKKTQTKLPCYKKRILSIQPPSKLARGPAVGGSLSCLSLEHHGVCGENKAPGTALLVHTAGDNRIAKTGAQTHPQEKPSDRASTQKRSLLKRAYQGKGQTEKPTSGVLLAAGQIPRAAPSSGSAASCLECPQLLEENRQLLEENRRLLEENRRLKTMLDKSQHKEWQEDNEDVDNSKL